MFLNKKLFFLQNVRETPNDFYHIVFIKNILFLLIFCEFLGLLERHLLGGIHLRVNSHLRKPRSPVGLVLDGLKISTSSVILSRLTPRRRKVTFVFIGFYYGVLRHFRWNHLIFSLIFCLADNSNTFPFAGSPLTLPLGHSLPLDWPFLMIFEFLTPCV